VNINDILMHYRAAREAGPESACGSKQAHGTEEQADRHAAHLNGRVEVKLGQRHRVEAYPCPFCFTWHVGREMTFAEREQWVRASDCEQRKNSA